MGDSFRPQADGFHPPPEMLLEIGNKGGVPPAELEVRGVHCRADLYVGERLVKAVSAGEFASGRVHVAVYVPGRIGGLDRNCLLLLHWTRMSKRRHGFTMVPLFSNGRPGRRGLAFRLRERRYHRLFHGESVDGLAYGATRWAKTVTSGSGRTATRWTAGATDSYETRRRRQVE